MKTLRFLMIVGLFAFSTGCTEEIITPQGGGDDGEDKPIVVDPDSGS